MPLLVICGDVAWAETGGRLLQDSGPEGIAVEHLLGGVTRAAIRVAQPRTAATQALAALAAATNPARPGPALLVIPIQIANAPAAETPCECAPIQHRPAARPGAPALVDTLQMLEAAQTPLIVLGAGCREAVPAIHALVETLGIPCVTTPQAKGILGERHRLSLRHGGLAASSWARRYTALGVDAALVLGTDLDDCSVGPTPYVAPDGRLIHVDLDPNVFGRTFETSLAVQSDVGAFAEDLVARIRERDHGFGKRCDDQVLRDIHAASPFAEPAFASDESPTLAPHRVVADLERAVGPEAAFVTDIGEHMLFALHYLTAESSARFTIHLGLGSMGSGIGSAVGLTLAAPRRRVVCICGDGGMQMMGMEALVALRERLPVVFAVFNDGRYNMVFHGWRQVFGYERPWDTVPIDFVKWADAMRLPAACIDRPGQITAGLLETLARGGGPCLLDIRIDRDVRLAGSGRNEALLQMSMGAAK